MASRRPSAPQLRATTRRRGPAAAFQNAQVLLLPASLRGQKPLPQAPSCTSSGVYNPQHPCVPRGSLLRDEPLPAQHLCGLLHLELNLHFAVEQAAKTVQQPVCKAPSAGAGSASCLKCQGKRFCCNVWGNQGISLSPFQPSLPLKQAARLEDRIIFFLNTRSNYHGIQGSTRKSLRCICILKDSNNNLFSTNFIFIRNV